MACPTPGMVRSSSRCAKGREILRQRVDRPGGAPIRLGLELLAEDVEEGRHSQERLGGLCVPRHRDGDGAARKNRCLRPTRPAVRRPRTRPSARRIGTRASRRRAEQRRSPPERTGSRWPEGLRLATQGGRDGLRHAPAPMFRVGCTALPRERERPPARGRPQRVAPPPEGARPGSRSPGPDGHVGPHRQIEFGRVAWERSPR